VRVLGDDLAFECLLKAGLAKAGGAGEGTLDLRAQVRQTRRHLPLLGNPVLEALADRIGERSELAFLADGEFHKGKMLVSTRSGEERTLDRSRVS